MNTDIAKFNKTEVIKERIFLWDNVKFLLIVLVVIGHFVDELSNYYDSFKSLYLFIYAFHMPLFLFISGLFYKSKNILNKCLVYIAIGMILKIVNFSVKMFLGLNPSFSLLSESGIPWFMFALAVYTFITYVFRNQNRSFLLFFSILIALFVGFDKEIGDFLCLSRIIVFFPFYFLGTIIKQDKIVKLKKNYEKPLFIISIIIILIWGYLCIMQLDIMYNLRHLFTGRNSFSQEVYNYGPLFRFICYMISVILSISIIGIVPNKNLKRITLYGKRTIAVFFWHYAVIFLLFKVFNFRILCSDIYGKLIFLEIAVLLTIILCNEIFSFPTKQITRWIKKEKSIELSQHSKNSI